LLKLMMRFKLCYEIRDQPHHYISPQLLEIEKPDYDWDETDNLILRYEYEFMPKGILTRFIVEMHEAIEQPTPERSLVWKEGVILTNGRARAEAIEYYHRSEIRIRVSGFDKKRLLSIMDHEFETIHRSYERLKYNKFVPCNCNTCKGSQQPHAYAMETLLKFWQDRKPIQCQKSYEMVDVRKLIDDAIDFETAIQAEQRKSIHETAINQEQRNYFTAPGSTFIFQPGDTTVTEPSKPEETASPEKPITLPWSYRNGLYYLLVFVVVIFSIAIIAGALPLYSLIVTVIAGVFFIVLIGVLQLRMDDRYSEENTTKLITLVIEQIPMLGNVLKPILNRFDKG
jgi:internalin A